MEELVFIQQYAGTITAVVGGISAAIVWFMARKKTNLDAKTSMFEQQRLNMAQLLEQNREMAEDLAMLRQRLSVMHEEQLELMNEVRAMKTWYFMRVQFCDSCGLVDDAQRIFGIDKRKKRENDNVSNDRRGEGIEAVKRYVPDE